jgi:hypothetical protein
VAAFELDPDLLEVGPAPPEGLSAGTVPRDTRLDARGTAQRLAVTLPDLDGALHRLRGQLEDSRSLT